MSHAFISTDAIAEAKERLADIEREDDVEILFAIESGSRAWGFPSPDSDYDVRFFYIRPLKDYLALTPPRDVVERELIGLWDVNGWDLAKALKLAIKGNAIVHEWLVSPIVYRTNPAFADAFRWMIERHFDWAASSHHYGGLLKGQFQRDLADREQVALKKYFYTIRAAVSVQWLLRFQTPPPMRLQELLAAMPMPADAAAELEPLLEAKIASHELGLGPRQPALDRYIDDALASLAATPARTQDVEAFTAEAEALLWRTLNGWRG